MSNQIWARNSAVKLHDTSADKFQNLYALGQTPYDTGFAYGRRQISKFFQTVIDKLPAGAAILDVGCGTGHQLVELLDQGFQAVGIEPSAEMRRHAESKLPPETVRPGTILNLPFDNDTFDFVYAIEVLRYLNEADNVAGLQELRRVLKPGGIFFGTFVNRYALDGFAIVVALRKALESLLNKPRRYHTEFETPGKVAKTFHSLGFREVEIHGTFFAAIRNCYKIHQPFGRYCARSLEPYDPLLCDTPFLRPFAGHIIGIARK